MEIITIANEFLVAKAQRFPILGAEIGSSKLARSWREK